jgi:hypothetical protein
MKKLYIIICLVLAMLTIQAQDYLISFAGTGGSTTVDSVQVKNLTQNTSLTLDGTDVLHLMGVVGIDQVIAQGNSDLRIYPNPMNEQSFIKFETTSSGTVTIYLADTVFIHGLKLIQVDQHAFRQLNCPILVGGVYCPRIKTHDQNS